MGSEEAHRTEAGSGCGQEDFLEGAMWESLQQQEETCEAGGAVHGNSRRLKTAKAHSRFQGTARVREY